MITSARIQGVRPVVDVLRALRETPPPGNRVLSVHLDTSPARVMGQAHLLALRDACKALREQLEAVERAERLQFEAAVAQAEDYVAKLTELGDPGLAVFASGEPGYFLATPLPVRVADRVEWGERPIVEPLEQAIDDYERIAVLLFDKERSRLFTIFLGEIEERQILVDEVPGKQKTGGWFALAERRYERHHEDHVLRHAKRTIRALMEVLRTHPFDRLLIGGPTEAVSLLQHHLPRPLRDRLAGTISVELFASDADVLRVAIAAAEEAERREEFAAVQELIDGATTANVTLGLEPTLAALSEGRVHRLLAAGTLSRDGARCDVCGRLTGEPGPCPTCGEATRPIADLREQAIEAAIAQGARVDIVGGEAADLLMGHGGLGAWTRYSF